MDSDRLWKVRYSRNISVEGIGVEGQQKLSSSAVCIIGCGALGSIAASYLAGAGIGKITVADFDNIDLSNLQRQLSFTENDCGKSKSDTLAQRLREINSEITVVNTSALITSANIESLILGHDFVLDCSDNPDTKYIIERACTHASIAHSIGGVLAMRGQLMTWSPGTTRYSDIFPQKARAGFTPCSVGGVLGPVPGVIGSLQALEAIKFITGVGSLLTDRLLIFDGRSMTFTQIQV